MNEMYILKEAESVASVAKNIFGDIVNKVYYAELHYDFRDEEKTIASIDYKINHSFNDNKSIDQDDKTIIIEFVNGKRVIFFNSEWGSMEAFNSSEIKKIV